jgi:hypothetical protein
VGRLKGSAAEGWPKDGTATALKYTRKLRQIKDEQKRLKARAQNLSERVAKVAKCKQNKFKYSRSGLKLSEGQVRKDEHELAHLQQKLLQKLLAASENQYSSVAPWNRIYAHQPPRPGQEELCLHLFQPRLSRD